MTPIELATRRRVTGLTSGEFAKLFVTLERKVDGESAQWDASDVESWEIVGPPVVAEQHLNDAFAAANEFVATLAKRLYRTAMPAQEGTALTAFPDDLTFWSAQPDFGGIPHALWNIAALQAAEWIRQETGIICELHAREPLV
ncbi:hypothetical protein BISA_1971 [Bifidobacterium saguini DSM 23967]|uniref:Uncharacterized protein n=2 Tax=Bifidobacterium saguini TaxID=762210 RepID=A0A087D642_9BIFI|nr:hypothetical protein [Bifidobacterium saguini]KFI90992.1 hypothetical protein BISA_1971 [Bifidobacterium saguini DSM 23967]QTB91476.1 hypothetical protein BSD967_03400 [Bifidobacterium saguini]